MPGTGSGQDEWPYEQINNFSSELRYPLLRLAALKYPEGPYAKQIADVPVTALPPQSQLRLSPMDPLDQLHAR